MTPEERLMAVAMLLRDAAEEMYIEQLMKEQK